MARYVTSIIIRPDYTSVEIMMGTCDVLHFIQFSGSGKWAVADLL